METKLPSTPADVLEISSGALRVVIKIVVGLAERYGFWKSPLKKTASASEEMSPLDSLYWIYKSRNPITRREKPMPGAGSLDFGDQKAELPDSFVAQHTVTVGAGGDILRSKGIDDSQDILFAKVQDLLFEQDVSYANFESPVTEQNLVDEVIGDAGPPIECCSKSQFETLTSHNGKRFDVLNTANNHMFDMGLEGIDTTLKVFGEQGILDVGTNTSPDQYGKAKILTRNGIRIGFVSDCFGLNGHELPANETHRIHVSKLLSKRQPPDFSLLKAQIDDCREKQCDFIIASIHWGYEFEFFPRQVQIKAARSLVEYGADSIICHHPHVIQPVEVYQTKRDPNRKAVIAYSLGSLTWGFMAPHIVLSVILNLKLTKGVLNGDTVTHVDGVCATPVFRTLLNEGGKTITRIEKLSSHLNSDSPFTVSYLAEIQEYADLVLGKGWRDTRGQ